MTSPTAATNMQILGGESRFALGSNLRDALEKRWVAAGKPVDVTERVLGSLEAVIEAGAETPEFPAAVVAAAELLSEWIGSGHTASAHESEQIERAMTFAPVPVQQNEAAGTLTVSPKSVEQARVMRAALGDRPLNAREWILGESKSATLAEQKATFSELRESCRKFFDLVEGMVVDEQLAGSNGMAFTLLPDAHHTSADIDRAAMSLRRNRDVVDLKFVRIEPHQPALVASDALTSAGSVDASVQKQWRKSNFGSLDGKSAIEWHRDGVAAKGEAPTVSRVTKYESALEMSAVWESSTSQPDDGRAVSHTRGISQQLRDLALASGLHVEGTDILFSSNQGGFSLDHWLTEKDGSVRVELRMVKKEEPEWYPVLENAISEPISSAEAGDLITRWGQLQAAENDLDKRLAKQKLSASEVYFGMDPN